MATPVGNLTVDEANAEFGKLVNQITAIDEKLKSGYLCSFHSEGSRVGFSLCSY